MNKEKVLYALLRKELAAFIQKTFNEINPVTQYLPNQHILAIAWALTQCLNGKTKRLIITVPPRNLKSVSASVAFVAWALGHNPALRLICISYAQSLAERHAADTRRVMASDWYKRIFPNTRITKATQTEIVTDQHGFRFATSTGGSLTGIGGNFIIIDDIHKADEAQSDIKRNSTIDFYLNSVISRLDDKQNGVIVIIQQRLHEDDLVGRLLSTDDWEHLNLPAIAEDQQSIPIGPDKFWTREPGDILHPEREPANILDSYKNQMGAYTFAAQYQQRPAPLGGGILKWSWFKTCKQPLNRRLGDFIVQSWDTAYTINDTSDWTVCTTWLVRGDFYFLIDIYRERHEFPSVEHAIYLLADRYKADIVLIENVGAGQALCQRLRQAGKLNVTSAQPRQDKATRMMAESPAIERGQVYLPTEADWLESFKREVLNFPNGRHDDQVDSLWLFLYGARNNFQGANYFVRRTI